MKRLVADLLLLTAAAIWGLAFYFQKTAMNEIGPFLFIACRSIIAALTLAPLALMERRRAEAAAGQAAFDLGGLVRLGAVGGVCFFLGAVFQQYGMKTATVTNAGFLTSLYVVVVPFIVWLTAGRAPSVVVWSAVALAFAGTWALAGGSIAGLSEGDVLIVVCALFWAAYMVVTSRSPRFGAPMGYVCVTFAVVATLAAAGALLFEPISAEALGRAAGSIAYVGVLSSALCFTLLAIAMKHTPASEAAVLMSMETLFAALAGALLLGERLPPVGWLGAALMFSATLLVQLAPRAKPAEAHA
jgi:drug/metabolite transporter (DMT)-like permease